jgi:gas vesicle protein
MWDERDNTDFLAALAIGAIAGLGLTLLFRRDPPTRRERLMKELKPYRKKLSKRARHARDTIGKQATAAAKRGDSMVTGGRDALESFRSEVSDIVSAARSDIAAAVQEQVGVAQDSLKRTAKRIRNH